MRVCSSAVGNTNCIIIHSLIPSDLLETISPARVWKSAKNYGREINARPTRTYTSDHALHIRTSAGHCYTARTHPQCRVNELAGVRGAYSFEGYIRDKLNNRGWPRIQASSAMNKNPGDRVLNWKVISGENWGGWRRVDWPVLIDIGDRKFIGKCIMLFLFVRAGFVSKIF